MKLPARILPQTAGLCIALALLAACGAQSPVGTLGPMQQNSMQQRATARTDGSAQTFLYVSDIKNKTFTVYSYPAAKLVKKVVTFDWPRGLCSNSNGDVWVANEGENRVTEYLPDSTKHISELFDPGTRPSDCSVDPTTGNLAVANIGHTSGTPIGKLLVYPGAKLPATVYSDPNFYRYYYCGYDDKGDLFVDGIRRDNRFQFAELPKGSSTLVDVTINETIASPGGVQWDGTDVAVGDSSTDTIYRVSVSGSSGTVVGTTTLTNGSGSVFFIDGAQIIGEEISKSGTNFALWKYPAGGKPTKSLDLSDLDGPSGVVLATN